jgi:hypothetical protein
MTPIEAVEVARIVSMADGGCSNCVANLTDELAKSFPMFDWGTLVAQFWDGELIE